MSSRNGRFCLAKRHSCNTFSTLARESIYDVLCSMTILLTMMMTRGCGWWEFFFCDGSVSDQTMADTEK